MCVYTYTVPTWTMIIGNRSGARTKIVVRVFCIDSALYGVHYWKVIFSRNFFSSRNFNLLFYKIMINNLFCNRVLNLYSGIHFHEIKIFVFIHQEFDSAHTFIFHCFSCFHRCFPHFFPKLFRHKRRRGFFHKFLVSSLN